MDYLFSPQIDFILKRGGGIKSCLFDYEAKKIISNLIPFSLFQDFDFFHFDYITNRKRIKIDGISCVVFIRPSSIKSLVEELSNPFYSNYIVFFTSPIDPLLLEILANADINYLITEIYELNLDVLKQDTKIYTIGSEQPKRIVEGIQSVVFALGINPNIKVMNNEKLKDIACTLNESNMSLVFKKEGTMILLSRNFDLMSPLIYDWHYQSLIYEHTGAADSMTKIDGKDYSLNNFFMSENKFLEISKVGENIQKLIKDVENRQEGLGAHNFEELGKCLVQKSIMESQVKIYSEVINKCMINKEFSEIQNEILKSKDNFNLPKFEAMFDESQIINLILVYLLRYVKNWEEFLDRLPKYKNQILNFKANNNPIYFGYKHTTNKTLDIKLGYVSPLKKIIKHIVMQKCRENTLININDENKQISHIIIYIDGGVTMSEYRIVSECEKEYGVDIILIGTHLLTSESFTSLK